MVVILASVAFLVQKNPNEQPESITPKVVEFSNTDKLNSLLLKEQYQAVTSELSYFLQTKINPNISHATIDNTKLNNDGSIEFSVKTEQPAKTILVSVERPSFDVLTIDIPESNYKKTVKPFDVID
jgi:hypothetical protein